MPPLPSPRPQTGQILDSWRHKRRQEALALCVPGLPGIPKKWTDAATNKHGYLLDLIRLRTGGASLHRAMEEALPFFSLPSSTSANGAPMRACSALSSTPNVRQSRPRRPAQSALACPRPGRAFWRARPPAPPCLSAKASKPCYLWSSLSPAFLPRRLYRQAAFAPSNHHKTSPRWSSPAKKMWKAVMPRTVFSAVVLNTAFPQS